MTQTQNKILWYVAGFLAAIAVGIWSMQFAQKALGSAPSGLAATAATSSVNFNVGPNLGTTLFATSTNCAARVISTGAQPISLFFNDLPPDDTIVNGNKGLLQSASTTVAYDGGIYGCNAIKAYGYNATATVHLLETR